MGEVGEFLADRARWPRVRALVSIGSPAAAALWCLGVSVSLS